MPPEASPEVQMVRAFLQGLQEQLAAGVRELDPVARERRDPWTRAEGGGGIAWVWQDGPLLEKGGVNFSEVWGPTLPAPATRTRPQLAGKPFRALGVSVVFHPRSPYLPTTHMNVRYFEAGAAGDPERTWWFGGGFDLTPYYPFLEDARSWHRAAQAAVAPYGADVYRRFKEQCDAYFYLPHRGETRGVGGLFFDDFHELGFDRSFALMRSVGEAFFPAYRGIVEQRRAIPYGERERSFQLYRRGRYVEFNLLYDRGTLFGLHSQGRTESILMSLPPEVRWEYDWQPTPDSPEALLYRDFLRPRDWLGEA